MRNRPKLIKVNRSAMAVIRKIHIVILLIFFSSLCLVAQDIPHLEKHYSATSIPTTSKDIEGKTVNAAKEYESYAPIPRIVLYDIAYPSDSLDCDDLGGNALMLVTAIVQDSDEYPFGGVRVESSTDTTMLDLLFDMRSSVPEQNLNVRHVFGKDRVDAFYLFPMELKKPGNELKLDFATNRDDFRIDKFVEGIPDGAFSFSHPSRLGRNDAKILKFIGREYPDLKKIIMRE